MFKVSILDGYVDEPSCLGVPPYISPYPRYIAGAVWSVDKDAQILYMTIDQLRNDKSLLDVLSESDIIVVVAGMSVPGRYLSGFPISPNEIVFFLKDLPVPLKILCGPAARFGFGISGGKKTKDTYFVEDVFNLIIKGDGEIVLSELLKNKGDMDKIDSLKLRKQASDIRDFAVAGSSIVCQHPFYPDYLITEIETYRGCSRSIVGGCSFCSEPSKGPPDFRSINGILDEIKALYKQGIRHFRLGNQPCIFSYIVCGGGFSVSGDGNVASGFQSAVVCGRGNDASGSRDFIGCGSGNICTGIDGVIGGGAANTQGAGQGFIGSGATNEITILGSRSVIGGGEANFVAARSSTIGGGFRNTIIGSSGSFIGGGFGNTGSAANCVVGGGTGNTALGDNSVVGGGEGNAAEDEYTTIGGGFRNLAVFGGATIGGGLNNYAGVTGVTIGGGIGNTGNGESAVVGGGSSNRSLGANCVVGGGTLNAIWSGSTNTIGGGASNGISGGTSITIAGGGGNLAFGTFGTISGGEDNQISDGAGGAAGNDNTISGGEENRITGAGVTRCSIGGGVLNEITASYGTIGGGASNVGSGAGSSILGGTGNVAVGVRSVVGGGQNNHALGTHSFVGGGGCLTPTLGSSGNIAAGRYSVVCGGGLLLTPAPGDFAHLALGDFSFIGGGGGGTFTPVDRNRTDGDQSAIVAGSRNYTGPGASGAFIGAGFGNTGMAQECVICGGRNNKILDTISLTSGILAGSSGSIITGPNSSIVGGRGNVIRARDSVIVGGRNGLVETANSSFFVFNGSDVAGSFPDPANTTANSFNVRCRGTCLFDVGGITPNVAGNTGLIATVSGYGNGVSLTADPHWSLPLTLMGTSGADLGTITAPTWARGQPENVIEAIIRLGAAVEGLLGTAIP